MLIELFALDVTAEALRANIKQEQSHGVCNATAVVTRRQAEKDCYKSATFVTFNANFAFFNFRILHFVTFALSYFRIL